MTTSTSVAETPVVRAADGVRTWSDIVAWARAVGLWQDVADEAAAAVEALGRAKAQDAAPSRQELAPAEAAWRRARGLLTADELRECLAYWHLDVRGWRSAIAGILLADPPDDDTVAVSDDTALRHAIVSGDLEDLLDQHVRWVAAGEALTDAGITPVTDPDGRRRQVTEHLVDPRRIDAHVEAHALDWIEVEADALVLPDRDMALEARLCVLHDGTDAADVATLARIEAETISSTLSELDGDRAVLLGAAIAGEVLGPRETDDGHEVLVVRHRRAADPTDPNLRERAAAELTDLLIRAQVQDRFDWFEGWYVRD